MSEYYTQLQQAYDNYNAERDYDYGKWADGRDFAYGQFGDDRAYAYQQERDKVSDTQWQEEFDESKRQYDQQYALAADKSSGGSDGGTKENESSGGGNYDADTAKIQQMLKDAGYNIAVDGIWGPKTQAAYDDYNGKPKEEPYTLSDAAQQFMSKLPYAHAGSSAEAWKNVVEDRLIGQYEKGLLSEEDVEAIIYKLGLDK